MELNASDERGINVVRTKVKSFAQITAKSNTLSSYPCPPYKLIILDEADSMTPDAQAALRRTMETYSKTTRFCIICNYVSRIIDPLASRCAKFRFKPLNEETMANRIKFICEKENITYTEQLSQTLAESSEGDLRKAITFLQSAHTLYGKDTNSESIVEISGRVPSSVVDNLLKAATSNSFDQLQKAIADAIASGFPANQILSQMFDKIVEVKTLSNLQKAQISEQIAQSDRCLQEGADEFLQLMSALSCIMKENSSPH